jgi:hypothetical protein
LAAPGQIEAGSTRVDESKAVQDEPLESQPDNDEKLRIVADEQSGKPGGLKDGRVIAIDDVPMRKPDERPPEERLRADTDEQSGKRRELKDERVLKSDSPTQETFSIETMESLGSGLAELMTKTEGDLEESGVGTG